MNLSDIRAVATELGPLTTFGTVDGDGTPHLVPVIGSWLEDKLVFGSRADSRKVRNLRDRPLASAHFATPGAAFPDALLLKGFGRVVDDDAERATYWACGSFPYLPMMYSGPGDPALRFVEFVPSAAVLVRNGGRGPVERWSAARATRIPVTTGPSATDR